MEVGNPPPRVERVEAVRSAPSAWPVHRQGVAFAGRRLYNAAVMLLGDGVGLTASLAASTGVFLWWAGTLPSVGGWAMYVAVAWSVGAALMHLAPSWGLGPIIELRRTVSVVAVTFGSAAVVAVTVRGAPEEAAVLVGGGGIATMVVPFLRLKAKRLLIAQGKWGVPAVIYGDGKTARHIVRLLTSEAGIGYRPVLVVTNAPGAPPGASHDAPHDAPHDVRHDDLQDEVLDEPLGGASSVSGVPIRPAGDATVRAASARIPVAIVAQPDVVEAQLKSLLEDSIERHQTVLIIPDLSEAPSLWARPRDISGTIGLEIPCNLARPIPQALKRTTDLVLTAASALVWGPLCLAIAALIWLEDRHPPLFFQERVGRGGGAFWTWKFRTMVPDAEAVLRQRLAGDPALRREWKAGFKLRDDPRITRVGRVLRSFSLDELPQLVNVLTGDMSLVGPRPLPRYHADRLAPAVRALRRRVRPGITGLWQVSGRSDAGTEGMERLDPYYVRNWSLWLDVVILVRTTRAVVQRTGAY
jgi:lipopolysaccharide/colanic/teichoic acid biosynthesis glycosyltransferase